jgi:DNA gyrase subunit B
MMSLTTMDPSTRRLIKVCPDDMEMTQWMFDMLLGDDLAGRKEFITNNGIDYLEMADIS